LPTIRSGPNVVVRKRRLGEKILDQRHIGSASVPGILAKPILDILAVVKALADVEAFKQDLNKVGYEDKGDGGVFGGRFFVKGGAAKRTHHLNFGGMNSFFWESHLAFATTSGSTPMQPRSIPYGNEALLIDFQMTAAHTQL
jgi:GrpB-like predicted nucleotidyltransferase (UPF0157 family)